jgi:hypothetical protein
MLLTSSIRGHLLSLKFHPKMLTRIQHLQTPISSLTASKMHIQEAKTIQLGQKIEVPKFTKGITHTCPRCATLYRKTCAHARDALLYIGKPAHMRDCLQEKSRTSMNDAFMVLVAPPPTFGSTPKFI